MKAASKNNFIYILYTVPPWYEDQEVGRVGKAFSLASLQAGKSLLGCSTVWWESITSIFTSQSTVCTHSSLNISTIHSNFIKYTHYLVPLRGHQISQLTQNMYETTSRCPSDEKFQLLHQYHITLRLDNFQQLKCLLKWHLQLVI